MSGEWLAAGMELRCREHRIGRSGREARVHQEFRPDRVCLAPVLSASGGKVGPPLMPDIRGYDEVGVGQEVEAICRRALDAGVSAFSLLPGRQGVTVWHHFGEAAQEVDDLPKEGQDSL